MNRSKVISYGGISTALSLIILYLTNVIPVNKMFLLGLSSCLMVLTILLIDLKSTFIVYVATSLLTFILNPNKGVAILYIVLFGLYPFIKHFVERKRNIPIELLLKLLYFNVAMLLSYVVYSKLFVDIVAINLSMYLLLLVLQVLFIIYDFVLTSFVGYSHKSLLKKLKK